MLNDFKQDKIISTSKKSRIELFVQPQEHHKKYTPIKFLTEEQQNDISNMINELFLDDEKSVNTALNDLFQQINFLGCDKIVAFFDINVIKRIIELAKYQNFCFDALRIISYIRDPEFSQLLLINGIFDIINIYINQPNQTFAELIALIIGNNSLICSDFRDTAVEQGIIFAIAKSHNISPKLGMWVIKNSLVLKNYPLNFEYQVTHIIIQSTEDPHSKTRHLGLKAFLKLIQNGYHEFCHIIIEQKYLNVLADIFQTESEKYKIISLKIINECFLCGETAMSQIIDYDIFNMINLSINKSQNDELLLEIINFLNTSFVYERCCIFIIEKYCNSKLSQLFENHRIDFKIKLIQIIQKLFNLCSSSQIINSITPKLIQEIFDIFFSLQSYQVRHQILLILESIFTKCYQDINFIQEYNDLFANFFDSEDFFQIFNNDLDEQQCQFVLTMKSVIESHYN